MIEDSTVLCGFPPIIPVDSSVDKAVTCFSPFVKEKASTACPISFPKKFRMADMQKIRMNTGNFHPIHKFYTPYYYHY